MLGRLRAAAPRSLELETSIRALDLTRHEAELALRAVAPRGAGLVVTKLLHSGWSSASALLAASYAV